MLGRELSTHHQREKGDLIKGPLLTKFFPSACVFVVFVV